MVKSYLNVKLGVRLAKDLNNPIIPVLKLVEDSIKSVYRILVKVRDFQAQPDNLTGRMSSKIGIIVHVLEPGLTMLLKHLTIRL